MEESNDRPKIGGLARYCVEHREVTWLFLAAAVAWGLFACTQLAQQEDPTIPMRAAVLVTRFPGAAAAQVEELVTRKLEQKITELASVEETKSVSRNGSSAIYITLRPAAQVKLDLEWTKIRAKTQEVELPSGCWPPFLDTDFGNTITLLYAVAARNIGRPEAIARARLIREAQAAGRGTNGPAAGRAAVALLFPSAFSAEYREDLVRRLVRILQAQAGIEQVRSHLSPSLGLLELDTALTREALLNLLRGAERMILGSDGEWHPDFPPPVLLLGDEDPIPRLMETPLSTQSFRALEKMAESLRDRLKLLSDVGKVVLYGNVPEAIYLQHYQRDVSGPILGYNQEAAAQMITAQNTIVPGGFYRADGQLFPVKITGQFRDEADIGNVVVATTGPNRTPIYLRDITAVQRGYQNPIVYRIDALARAGAALERRRSVQVSVEMKDGAVIRRFNEAVEDTVRDFQRELPDGAEILKISDQPASVAHRIQQFSKCFIEAVAVVVIVALFLMNWRSALVVALAIPLTVCLTLGGMHLLHVPLHQISIAALIVALGMLVDDPVVASDAINRELHHGQPRAIAAWLGPHRLRHAIFFGTIINIMAFLPLVLLPGDTGAFIYALPVVVTLALAASRIVSMTFIPLLGYYLLQGQKGLEEGGEIRAFPLFRPVDRALLCMLPRYRSLLATCLKRVWPTVGICYLLLAASFGFTGCFGTQFFPPAERNQFLIDVTLDKAASIRRTGEVCNQIVAALQRRPEIVSAAVYLGGTAPRFYYNVETAEPAENLAQILVNTRKEKDVALLLPALRAEFDRDLAGARCLVKQLNQGPGIEAPIQIRIQGSDLAELRALGDRVGACLRRAGGYKVADDLGNMTPAIEIEIDQDKANRLGVLNPAVGQLARSAFAELTMTELREGDHVVPVQERLSAAECNAAEKIRSLYVFSQTGEMIPLEVFARVRLIAEFPEVPHFNKLRTITVKSFAPFGTLPSAVLARARPGIAAIELPAGCRLEYAGEDKELKQSQSEMGRVMAISIALIALTMVVQFSSVIKSIVVMLTVPLGLIGAFFGLAVLRADFGFTALLAIVSLAGVIVSHIIVLSDFIEEARASGMDLKAALIQAGLVRLRAVLVTVLATVGGLIPLLLGGGALWKPLCAVHIFGLIFATALTLLLLPALYYIFCDRLKLIR